MEQPKKRPFHFCDHMGAQMQATLPFVTVARKAMWQAPSNAIFMALTLFLSPFASADSCTVAQRIDYAKAGHKKAEIEKMCAGVDSCTLAQRVDFAKAGYKKTEIEQMCANAGSNSSTAGAENWIRDGRSGCTVLNPSSKLNVTFTWSGSCVKGRANGYGTLTLYENGRQIEESTGQWENGKQEGYGTTKSQNNQTYEGQFKAGLKNGQGSLTLSNGAFYGTFAAGHAVNGLIQSADGTACEAVVAGTDFRCAPSQVAQNTYQAQEQAQMQQPEPEPEQEETPWWKQNNQAQEFLGALGSALAQRQQAAQAAQAAQQLRQQQQAAFAAQQQQQLQFQRQQQLQQQQQLLEQRQQQQKVALAELQVRLRQQKEAAMEAQQVALRQQQAAQQAQQKQMQLASAAQAKNQIKTNGQTAAGNNKGPHFDGSYDRSNCVSIDPQDGIGGQKFVNNCGGKVEVTWCTTGAVTGYTCKQTFSSLLNRGSYGQGMTTVGSIPQPSSISAGNRVVYMACDNSDGLTTPYLTSINPPQGMCHRVQ